MRREAFTLRTATFFMGLLVGFGTLASTARAQSRQAASTRQGVSPESPSAGTLYLYPERFRLEDGTLANAERGLLFVPVNRSDPNSQVVSVEIYRFKATGDIPSGRPPIFRLYGGPGFLGLEGNLEQPGFYEKEIQPFREVADVVVVGQRGIGSSRPHTACAPPPRPPLDARVKEGERVAALRKTAKRCKAFWQAKDYDLEGLNVIEAAADVADATKALGYEKITLWGGSFGSHWSMAVMRYHPEIVERALLRGLEGPNHTYDLPSYVLNALERVAADAKDAAALKGMIPDGGLIQTLKEVITGLEAKPMVARAQDPETGDTVNVRFGRWKGRQLAKGYSDPADSLHLMAAWPADILTLYAGDFSGAAKEQVQGRSEPPMWETASFFMLDCGSGITPEREARLNDDPAAEIVGNTAFLYQATCPVWDTDLGNDFRKNFETDIPTVMVHGNWDLSTPLENAQELAPYFQNGKLIVVKRGTHQALEQALEASPSFRKALMQFLATGDRSGFPDQVVLPPVQWQMPNQWMISKDAGRQ